MQLPKKNKIKEIYINTSLRRPCPHGYIAGQMLRSIMIGPEGLHNDLPRFCYVIRANRIGLYNWLHQGLRLVTVPFIKQCIKSCEYTGNCVSRQSTSTYYSSITLESGKIKRSKGTKYNTLCKSMNRNIRNCKYRRIMYLTLIVNIPIRLKMTTDLVANREPRIHA